LVAQRRPGRATADCAPPAQPTRNLAQTRR
jgi:hypothetical protein